MIRTLLISAGLIAVMVGGIAVFRNDSPKGAQASQQFSQVQSELESRAVMVDVRTPEEYTEAHVSGAQNISLQQLQQGVLPQVEKSKKLYVYCRSGSRSAQAAKILTDKGYKVEDLGAMTSVAAMGTTIVQ